MSIENASRVTVDEIIERFSSWEKLKRFVAWILRYRANLRKATAKRSKANMNINIDPFSLDVRPLDLNEMRQAEKKILKYVQGSRFQEELVSLNRANYQSDEMEEYSKGTIRKSSHIHKLDPQLKEELILVGGRLANAPISEERKHPIIIPKNNTISTLIARYYHHLAGHSGLEHVLSMIRERYWIIGARPTLKKMLNSCVDCRKRQPAVGEQKMVDLPTHRVTPEKPLSYSLEWIVSVRLS